MSYDISIHVKAEGCDVYPMIAEPEYSSPTYNLSKMFRACMDWEYSQVEKDESGEYKTCYYPCDVVIEKVERGIRELTFNKKEYEKYNPENGWGSISSAIKALESLRDCIYRKEDDGIPISCMYMRW